MKHPFYITSVTLFQKNILGKKQEIHTAFICILFDGSRFVIKVLGMSLWTVPKSTLRRMQIHHTMPTKKGVWQPGCSARRESFTSQADTNSGKRVVCAKLLMSS